MDLGKILHQYVSSYQGLIKSVIRLGNNEVLKTLTKTLTFKCQVCDLNLKVTVMKADGVINTFDQYLSWYQIGTKSIM